MIPHTARAFTNSFNFHKKIFNYKPKGKISVFVNDFSDFGNGGAVGIPFSFVMVGINPFDNIYENMPANERIQWLSSHELTHIIMSDKPGTSENFFRNIFSGKPLNDNTNPLTFAYSYLASSRWYSPRWFHEGIAIFMETFMNGGNGRILAGYDEMVFRTMVIDSAYFYRPVGLETEGSTIDFMVGANAYLYGTRFDNYLAGEYGVDKLLDFYTVSDSSKGFFASQFQKVYKNDLLSEWEKWVEFENNFQNENLKLIRKNPVTKHKLITDVVLGSASRQFYDKNHNSIITAVNFPGKLAHLAEISIETGKIREIAPIMSPRLYFVTNVAYDESSRTIFVTENNSNYRDLVLINADNGDEIKRLEFERIGDPVFNKSDKSLWGVRNYNGRSIISRLLPPYDKTEELYSIPFGYNFFDLDISPDWKILSGTYSDPNGSQKIIHFKINDILQGKYDFAVIYEFEKNSASNFTFSNDGKSMFGTSYITGVSNVFRIDINKNEAEILTNTERGYFRPIQMNNDTLMCFSYNSKGLQPVLIKIDTTSAEATKFLGMRAFAKSPELKNWNLPPISNVILDSLSVTEKEYSVFDDTRLAYLVPIVEGYKDFPSFGFKAKFIDKIYLNNIDLNLSYSYNELIPQKERLHFFMKYLYWNWEFTAGWNKADFYDLLGPTKRSREGGLVSLKYQGFINQNRSPEIFDYSISAGYLFDLQTLPQYQNISINADRLIATNFTLNYNVLRKSLGAVEYESGVDYKFHLSNEYVDNSNFFQIFGSAAFGSLLPIRNSSIWLRLFGGKSFGADSSPFNYFYFGGFGNNYLDNNSVQRYRDMLSFPGVEINSLAANSFAKATLEWNLPPYRFRKFGFLPAYITYWRLSLFSSLLTSEFDNNFVRTSALNAGAQIDFELSFFYLMKTYLSFGYAGCFRDGMKPSDEFMISLKF
jgi:hypothetical protein